MSSLNQYRALLDKVMDALEELDLNLSDIESIVDGDHTISIKVIKNNRLKRSLSKEPSFDFSEIISKLKVCDDRESGYAIIDTYLKNRKQLEIFAKDANIYIMKQDRIDRIKERIVEGIIGAKLRSNAIQDNT
ncbi:hypothetical protein [Aeromonas hydrophila]|uniref:hypothetical protein n=1 Tax=Aeromonas hydrophila TaxID=644 RepID=UPI0038D1A6B7